MQEHPETKEIFDETFRFRAKATSPLHNFARNQIMERLKDLKEQPHPFYEYPQTNTVPPYGVLFSNLQLQSMNAPLAFLKAAQTNLKENGCFMGVMLGDKTLYELRHCLIEAEATLSGGTHPRLVPMTSQENANNLLIKAGFKDIVLDHEHVILTYPDLWALMRGLRDMGLTNNLRARPKHFTKRALFEKANELYKENYATEEGGIKASFDLFFLNGWKYSRLD